MRRRCATDEDKQRHGAGTASDARYHCRFRPRCIDRFMFSDGLWIIYLEMLCAVGLAVFIVWWTMPRRKRSDEEARRPEDAAP